MDQISDSDSEDCCQEDSKTKQVEAIRFLFEGEWHLQCYRHIRGLRILRRIGAAKAPNSTTTTMHIQAHREALPRGAGRGTFIFARY